MPLSTRAIPKDIATVLAEVIANSQPPSVLHNFRLACRETAELGRPLVFKDIAISEPHQLSSTTTAVQRIKQFFDLCSAVPSIARYPRRLHLSVGFEQDWVASDALYQLVDMLKDRAKIEHLGISGGENGAPGDGYMLCFTLEPLAPTIKTLFIDNVLDIPPFFFSKLTKLEQADLRGVKSQGCVAAPSFRPAVKHLSSFQNGSAGGRASISTVFDTEVMSYLTFEHLESLHCDASQFAEFQTIVGGRIDGCPRLRALHLTLPLAGDPELVVSVKPILIPSLQSISIHALVEREAHMEEGIDPLVVAAVLLDAIRSRGAITVMFDIAIVTTQHQRFVELDWDSLDAALFQYASAHETVNANFQFSRRSNPMPDSQVFAAYVSEKFLTSSLPLAAGEANVMLSTVNSLKRRAA